MSISIKALVKKLEKKRFVRTKPFFMLKWKESMEILMAPLEFMRKDIM